MIMGPESEFYLSIIRNITKLHNIIEYNRRPSLKKLKEQSLYSCTLNIFIFPRSKPILGYPYSELSMFITFKYLKS